MDLKEGISVVHINIQCISNKILELDHFLVENETIKIVCISEHWLKFEQKKHCTLNDFKLISCYCRPFIKNGGACIFIHNSLSAVDITHIQEFSESQTCEICACFIDKMNVAVVCIYRSPNQNNIDQFLMILSKALNSIEKMNSKIRILLAGDFNVHFNNPEDQNNLKVVQMLLSYRLDQLFNEQTHVKGNCLDNIFCNFAISGVTNIPLGVSDHYAQIVVLKSEMSGVKHNNCIFGRKYGERQHVSFESYLNREQWREVYNATTSELKYMEFHNTLIYYHKISFTTTMKQQTSTRNAEWVTRTVEESKQRLLFLYEWNEKYPTERNQEIYRNYKKEYNKILEDAKRAYNCRRLNLSDNYSKTVWDIINMETGRKHKEKIEPKNLSPNDLNIFFINRPESLARALDASGVDPQTFLIGKTTEGNSMFFRPVTTIDIETILYKLKNKRTEDIYSISVYSLKKVSKPILEPLTHIFNSCIEEGCFPSALKLAKICPIYKKGNKEDPGNYRQISILPSVSKIFETIIYDQLLQYFDKFSIISGQQFGFRRNLSTSDAISHLIQNINNAFENKKTFMGVFTDLTAAFDCVDKDILVGKLEFYGIRGRGLDLIKSYLFNRYQVVSLSAGSSDPMLVGTGVPQGSVLGPLLFLVYMNDLPHVFPGGTITTIMYADDATFGISLERGEDSDAVVGSVLRLAETWFVPNRLVLNVDKTQSLLFDTVCRGGGDGIRFLGVTLDSNLIWTEHINMLCSRLNQNIYAIRKVRQTINIKVAITTYHALFESVLQYGIMAWGSCAITNLERVFKVQKFAIRTIAGISRDTSCREYFKSYQIMTVFGLIIYNKLVDVRKNIDNYVKASDIHAYPTRGCNDLVLPQSRLSRFDTKEFKLYNSLPHDIRKLDVIKFKKKIKRLLIENSIYSFSEFYNLVEQRDTFL